MASWFLPRPSVEQNKRRRITPRGYQVEPTVSVQVAAGHSVDRALSIAEGMGVEGPAGSVVVIDYAGGIDVADYKIRTAISVEIRGRHRVGQRLRLLELNAGPEIAFAVIEVNKAAKLLRACGDVGMAVDVHGCRVSRR